MKTLRNLKSYVIKTGANSLYNLLLIKAYLRKTTRCFLSVIHLLTFCLNSQRNHTLEGYSQTESNPLFSVIRHIINVVKHNAVTKLNNESKKYH